jgi:hypothetical protein
MSSTRLEFDAWRAAFEDKQQAQSDNTEASVVSEFNMFKTLLIRSNQSKDLSINSS